MRSDNTSLEFASFLLDAARLHGEDSEPDHEVGDLQTFFLACWSVMSPDQRALALANSDIQNVLEGPEYAALFE
jgi:hypothetical protein